MAHSAAHRKELPEHLDEKAPTPRVNAIMGDAERQGFLNTNESRITARLSRKMVDAAKLKTGITSDSELVKFAIAQIATEDPFKKVFKELRGSIDPDVDLEF
ncbi:hypothetical protein [Rhizobium sp. LjRoot254]|uniref:hypothetical protein n=1 Tax=Rhizobium sp. LjRoot254 TaxID=3342297 RepID=UPI003ED0B300